MIAVSHKKKRQSLMNIRTIFWPLLLFGKHHLLKMEAALKRFLGTFCVGSWGVSLKKFSICTFWKWLIEHLIVSQKRWNGLSTRSICQTTRSICLPTRSICQSPHSIVCPLVVSVCQLVVSVCSLVESVYSLVASVYSLVASVCPLVGLVCLLLVSVCHS